MTTNTFTVVTDDISKYSIQVRATVSSVCRAVGLWSEWSQPIYVGKYPVCILKPVASLLVKTENPGKCVTHSLWVLSFHMSTLPPPLSAHFLMRDGFTWKPMKLKCASFLLPGAFQSLVPIFFSYYLILVLFSFFTNSFLKIIVDFHAVIRYNRVFL